MREEIHKVNNYTLIILTYMQANVHMHMNRQIHN